MCAVAVPRPGEEENNGHHRKFFFLFVFGVALLCTGFLLSVFILQTCPSGTFSDCNRALKIAGPVVVAVGLVCVLLAQSRARLYLSQRQMQGDAVMTFPPLPPPYFADSLSPPVTHKPLATELPMSENPPPYHSIVNNGAQLAHVQGMVSVREYEPLYAIPGSSSSSDVLPTLHLSSELPPRYEEKEATVNTEYSSGSSMT